MNKKSRYNLKNNLSASLKIIEIWTQDLGIYQNVKKLYKNSSE